MASVDPITEGFTMKIPFPGVEPQIWPVAILLSCDKFWQPLSSHHPGWCVCVSLPYPPCCVSVLVVVALQLHRVIQFCIIIRLSHTPSIHLMFQTDKYELIKPAFYSKLTDTFVLN